MFHKIAAEVLGYTRIPVKAILAGGAAAHLYTQARISNDVDAIFLPHVHINDLIVVYQDEAEHTRNLVFDGNYFPEIGLINPDYAEDSLLLEQITDTFALYILSPVDLAVSKLARFQDYDRQDILALAKAGLLTAAALQQRATEALDYFVGDTFFVEANIRDACTLVSHVTANHHT
jgi:hypothetical protein